MKNLLRTLLWLCFFGLTLTGFFLTKDYVTTVELPKAGENPIFYANQHRDDLTSAYLQAIDKAETSILLLIYNLSDRSVINALKIKAAQGVDVTVVCDGKATRKAKVKLGENIKVYPRFDKGLMHLKILVVDSSTVLLGSANLSRHSLKIHGNLVLAFDSPEVASFITERAKEVAIGESHSSHDEFYVGNQKLELWFLPGDPDAVSKIISLIDKARKTVKVAMYTFTRRDFAEALARAKLRGVKVDVVMDRNSSKSSSKKIARYLHREGVPLNINTDAGLSHHKMMYIDNKTLVNGSANWTKAAFTQNNDCFIIIDKLTVKQQKKLNKLWEIISADSTKFKPR